MLTWLLVALSRAREGLFIFGNADNLSSRSKMWHSIIEELESIDCLGPALPIVCHRHPSRVEYISKPGILPQISPDGIVPSPSGLFRFLNHVLQVDVCNHVRLVWNVATIALLRSRLSTHASQIYMLIDIFSVTVMTLITSPPFVLSRVDGSARGVSIHAKNSVVHHVVNASFQLRTWSFHVVILNHQWNGKLYFNL